MPHSTVSDLGLYCLSHQDVSGKYYHFFIAKVTVSFFFLSDVKRLWLHVGNFFMHFCRLLMYLFYFNFSVFFKKKNIFFLRRNQNKKIKQLQSIPDQILFVQPDLGPNCMLML